MTSKFKKYLNLKNMYGGLTLVSLGVAIHNQYLSYTDLQDMPVKGPTIIVYEQTISQLNTPQYSLGQLDPETARNAILQREFLNTVVEDLTSKGVVRLKDSVDNVVKHAESQSENHKDSRTHDLLNALICLMAYGIPRKEKKNGE